MDDLDHSLHISEFDWASFYEESEECVLLQPTLACPDDSSLTDSEESVNIDSVLKAGIEDTQQSSDANGSGKCSGEEESCTSELKENANEDDVTQVEICLHVKTGEENSDDVANALQSEAAPSSEELTKDRNVQTESDLEPAKQPDPLSWNQTGQKANETPVSEGAASRDVSNVPSRAEKERWFVTVNDNPAPKRSASVKKKRKKHHRDGSRTHSSGGYERPVANTAVENKEKHQFEEGNDSQSNQRLTIKSEKHPSSEMKAESFQVQNASDSSQLTETSGDEDNVSEKRLITGSRKENTLETTSISVSQGTSRQLERTESDELDDNAEFLSTHSHDSESYLSAAESVEENQNPTAEKQHLQQSICPNSDNSLFARNTETHSCDAFYREDEANAEGYESRTPEPSLTFPSPEQSADSRPGDSDILSRSLCATADTSGAPTSQTEFSTSGSSRKDSLTSLPVPDLTITPCTVAQTPETFAQAAGHPRPVYAISAFWDEMEKLTINDILQLRMRRSSSPAERQESVTQNDDSPKSPVLPVEAGDDRTDDTADSDYFTQVDDSKPDRSSCEFSTSDFEEEYWQFLGASRNTSPDPSGKKQESEPPSLSYEAIPAASQERQTPVPSKEPLEPRSERLSLSELTEPRPIIKTKSTRNVPATLTSPSLLHDNESSLFLSSSHSLDESAVSRVSDSLITMNPPSVLCSTDLLDAQYQISFPEVFEHFFCEDKANSAPQSVKVYDPEDISVAPIFDFPLSALRDEISPSSIRSRNEEPIPIFSCSHPTVRDLTFPKLQYAFWSSNSEAVDDFSPIRFVSQSYIRADQLGSYKWKSLLSIRKIRFHDKGSMWCGRSGVWMFPAEEEDIAIQEEDPVVSVLCKEEVSPVSTQLFRELKDQQRILETPQTRGDCVFSTLKQSDMCLVCIAFASWVLKSSDPEAADAWKAALLANVSALSAIQYLRQYVKKKKRPHQDEP